MQKVPDLNLIPHEGEMTCDVCNEEVKFLIGPDPINDGKNRCRQCLVALKPEYHEALTDFAVLLDLMLDLQSRMMDLDTMHELYGNQGGDAYEEPEEKD